MEMEEQKGKTWNICGRSYTRTEELRGRTSRTGIQIITLEPCASFLLVITFSYTLHNGQFFLWGVSLTVPCCFTRGVSLRCPVLVSAGSKSCAPMHPPCWFIWGVSLIIMPCAVLGVEFLLHTPCWLLFLWSFIWSMLASLRSKFLLYKTKTKNVKVRKKVHNWVILLFKAEVVIQYVQAPQGCIMSSSRQCWNKQTWNGYLLISNYTTKHTHTQ